MPRVSVDPDLCVGTTDCISLAPSAFALNEEAGVSEPLPGAASTRIDKLIAAGRQCPTRAIRVVDDDGNVLVDSG